MIMPVLSFRRKPSGGSGLDILKELKNQNKTDGVLIISARNSLDDKVFALKTGADDYLTKPFHLAELAARVNAIIRRKSFEGKNEISCNELKLDLAEKNVKVHDSPVDLTRKNMNCFFILSVIKTGLFPKMRLQSIYGVIVWTLPTTMISSILI
jgi:Response regulators consisting of a CheY-like receiver domain and a winged-helix DNA-binding domain